MAGKMWLWQAQGLEQSKNFLVWPQVISPLYFSLHLLAALCHEKQHYHPELPPEILHLRSSTFAVMSLYFLKTEKKKAISFNIYG